MLGQDSGDQVEPVSVHACGKPHWHALLALHTHTSTDMNTDTDTHIYTMDVCRTWLRLIGLRTHTANKDRETCTSDQLCAVHSIDTGFTHVHQTWAFSWSAGVVQ